MSSKQTFIGLSLANVPLINLRLEILENLRLFRNERFRQQFPGAQNGEIRPIATERYTWYGMPNALLTHILRDSIVGLESAVGGAVYCEALDRRVMNQKIMEATKDPFSLGAKGTAACVYNALPSLIEKDFALELAKPDLWNKVKQFYKEVRNPIFHAYQIAEHDPNPTWKCLELLWEIYQWLNSWHPLEKVAGGMISWSEETLKDPGYVSPMSDQYARRLFPERSLLHDPEDDISTQDYSLEKIKFVKGIYVRAIDRVDVSLVDCDGKKLLLAVPPFEAMRLLDFLRRAQAARGWHAPENSGST